MHIMSFKKLTERGDTIVEVLIAIAVLSLILGGAFVLTNRSLQATRTAQERLNATKLVESQIEQIKNFAATSGDQVFSAPASFCINNSGVVKPSSDAGCHVGVDGAATSIEPIFNIAVTRSANTFTTTSTWNSVSGGKNSALIVYKVYE